MSHCEHCSGDCGHCAGCGASYVLNEGELSVLLMLEQYAFLPVARRADDLTPIYCGEGDLTPKEYSVILLCLEKKNLITIDFDMPLKGFDGYGSYPLRGSAGLTLQGQQVLDALSIQGAL